MTFLSVPSTSFKLFSRLKICVFCIPFCVFYYPIGASGINSGRIDFKPGANPSTTPFFEGGLHLNYSRWFYRTRPTLYRTPTEAARWPDSTRRFAASGVLGGVPVGLIRLRPKAFWSFGFLIFSQVQKGYLWYKGLFHDFMAGPGPKAFPEGFCKAPIVQ